MSLVDSDHIVPARERHGAHYYPKARSWDGKVVPAMTFKYTDTGENDNRCPKCMWLPFSDKETKCWRCGTELA